MHLKLNSIRARLLSGFLLLVLVTIAIIGVVFYFADRIEKINRTEDMVQELMMTSLHMMSLDEQFLKNDINNIDFFEDKNSSYLLFRDSLTSDIFRHLYKSKANSNLKTLKNDFQKLISELESYNIIYNEILNLYKERGFKNYGVEGEMRHWARLLEDSTNLNFKKEWVLTLRRHEKDYIMRKDSFYIEEFENYSNKLIERFNNRKEYQAGVEILKLYRNKFRELVQLEYRLGINQNEGKKNDLFQKKISTIDSFSFLASSLAFKVRTTSHKAKVWILTATSFAVLFSVLISILLANSFSKPVQNLSDNIKNFLYRDWKADLKLDENIDILELRSLTESYKKLVRQLKDQFEETKTKTEELDLQNSKLLKLGEEMDEFVRSSSRKLRAPLNSLQGLTELIKLKQLDTNDPQTIEMIEQALKQIENYLAEINEYVELRKDDLQIEDFNVKNIVEKIVKDKKIKSSVNLKFMMDIETGLEIKNDPKRFALVMNHIIDNSFQYFDREINELHLLITAKKKGDKVNIEIQDDGIGIEKEEIENVFKMFFRASHYSKGSGLGLYIAKASLKTMHGTVNIESEKDEGTKVIIDLPLSLS